MSTLDIALAGETVTLLPEPALWWPRLGMLLVADIHFGKAATFRALGQPVPVGTTAANLDRLEDALRRLQPSGLIFLGDFLHGRAGRNERLFNQLLAWRRRWPRLDCRIVRGNHDRRAGPPPAELDIVSVAEPLCVGPFALCHEPQPVPGHYTLAGHLHPAVVLRGRGRDRLRLPCFLFEEGGGVLPAFGEFTGTWPVEAAADRQLYAVGGGRVWAVSKDWNDQAR